MPTGLNGGDWGRVIQPLIYKNFRNKDLNCEIGGVSLSNLSLDNRSLSILQAGKAGIVLNGSTQYGTKSSPSGFNFGTRDFSVIAVFKKTTDNDAVNAIISCGDPGTNTTGGIELRIRDDVDSKIEAKFGDGATAVQTSGGSAWVSGTEYRVVVSCDRDGTMKLFVNGSAYGTAVSIAAYSASSLGNPTTFAIGHRPTGAIPFNGTLFEIQVVDGVALTVNDAALIESYGIPTGWLGGTVVSHYRWANSDGTDETGNNTLTLADSPTFTTGTFNQYKTFETDVWRSHGNLMTFTNPARVSDTDGAFFIRFKPLFGINNSANIEIFTLGNGNDTVYLYFGTDNAFSFWFNGNDLAFGAETLSSLQSEMSVLITWSSGLIRVWKNYQLLGAFASDNPSFSGQTSYIGASTSRLFHGICDFYNFAWFDKFLDHSQSISIINAYSRIF